MTHVDLDCTRCPRKCESEQNSGAGRRVVNHNNLRSMMLQCSSLTTIQEVQIPFSSCCSSPERHAPLIDVLLYLHRSHDPIYICVILHNPHQSRKSNATAMHKSATAPKLYTLSSRQDLQCTIKCLLAIAFAFDKFSSQSCERGGVAHG